MITVRFLSIRTETFCWYNWRGRTARFMWVKFKARPHCCLYISLLGVHGKLIFSADSTSTRNSQITALITDDLSSDTPVTPSPLPYPMTDLWISPDIFLAKYSGLSCRSHSVYNKEMPFMLTLSKQFCTNLVWILESANWFKRNLALLALWSPA